MQPQTGANRPVVFDWLNRSVGDQYQDGGSGLKDIKFAVNDAREFKELLVNEFGYPEDHVFPLPPINSSVDSTGQVGNS